MDTEYQHIHKLLSGGHLAHSHLKGLRYISKPKSTTTTKNQYMKMIV